MSGSSRWATWNERVGHDSIEGYHGGLARLALARYWRIAKEIPGAQRPPFMGSNVNGRLAPALELRKQGLPRWTQRQPADMAPRIAKATGGRPERIPGPCPDIS
jgi:hypothetical protein